MGNQRRMALIQKVKKARAKAQNPEDFEFLEDTLVRSMGEQADQPLDKGGHYNVDELEPIPKRFRNYDGKRDALSSLRWRCKKCNRTSGDKKLLAKQPCAKLTEQDYGYANRIRLFLRMAKVCKPITEEMMKLLGVTDGELKQYESASSSKEESQPTSSGSGAPGSGSKGGKSKLAQARSGKSKKR